MLFFKNIESLSVTLEIKENKRKSLIIESLYSISDKVNLSIFTSSESLKYISKNEIVSKKLNQFKNLEINWNGHFIFRRIENCESMLVINGSDLYFSSREDSEFNWTMFKHSNWQTQRWRVQESCNMLRDLIYI